MRYANVGLIIFDGLVKSPARPRLPQPVVLVVRVMTMHIVLSMILEYFLRDHQISYDVMFILPYRFFEKFSFSADMSS